MSEKDYAQDLSLKRLFKFAISEAKQAVRSIESIERCEDKIAKYKRSLEANDHIEGYAETMRKDIRLQEQGLKRFKQNKEGAMKEFLRLVDKIEPKII